ncbi:protein DCL homolog, chloroplastic-like [Cucurbita pepo subsp. pepo]|uniref:protein DCL homolog, chloroplastic-like n=1 Tax=Cucurbita pepo subsp. pepo TaxID=3664 RepID=UPI000C9D4AA1|nr:protein DCL homolog, chloroplastic-like [Cucurbita pepo subsp. pepo]
MVLAMASILKPPPLVPLHSLNPNLLNASPVIVCFRTHPMTSFHQSIRALKTGPEGSRIRSHEEYSSDLLRKPVVPPAIDLATASEDYNSSEESGNGDEEEEEWVDWEDRILEETVPLVGFVRMVLHSGKYESGDRLTPEHEKTILDRLLPYHPECEKKIGCGIDYITIGYHPNFERSRCLFIVRKDGELVDFSYWKCMEGLIRKNYPLHAESFILRHFQRRRRHFFR